MKKILIVRGGQSNPLRMAKDTFDSVIEVYADEDDKTPIKIIRDVNTDFANGYQGGIIAEGNYDGVVIDRADTKRRCVKLFFSHNKISSSDSITEEMRVFPSLIPNPNHNNKKIITQVLIHSDGFEGGYSQGCITIYPQEWNKFISIFLLNEFVKIEIVRNKNWTTPVFYLGN